ncbi:MAG TPA: 5'/3'-nucleotidase SurE [Leucothrix mucor]|uniref:5'-nucleotidase SurE n=1 Tax=Leucothrix mucor TaxID=45248 RepID=A0A7V2WVX2_LEUMU|nr:5'/3'-nucleotidase SurE [Leucothrix mucor]
MNILLSNDDGFIASGLKALHQRLSQQFEVMVVAPDRDRSGASNSLTLESPLRLTQRDKNFFSVNGTPTDCVHLALTGLYDNPPNLVISGINAGANLGDDVIYSGTVAAAMEGRNLGLPAIAVSIASFQPQYFSTAVEAVVVLLRQLSDFNEKSDTILNINVPDIPWNEVKGFKATRLGRRHRAEPVIKSKDPRGRTIYWVGSPGKKQDAGEGTDFYAIDQGYISVTPLQIDLTRHQVINSTEKWLDSL